MLPSSRSSAKAASSWPFSPAECHFDRRDPPARSRCSLCHFFRFRMVRLLVALIFSRVPRPSRLRCGTVRAGDGKSGKDFAIISARYLGHRPFPGLQPATGSWRSNRSSSAKQVDGRTEDFSLNRRRVDIIRLAVVLPEGRGFGHQRVINHISLAEAANHFVLSGKEAAGLKPHGRYSR